MHHDILGMVGRRMRACLLFAIDGSVRSDRLTIFHAIHLFIAFTFTLSFFLILVLFVIVAFGFEILKVSQPLIFWKFLVYKSADLACSIIVVHFRYCRSRFLSAVHLNIFAFGASWTSFHNFSSFFLRFFGAIGCFIIGKCVCLGLIWREFRRCGGFRVPDETLATT